MLFCHGRSDSEELTDRHTLRHHIPVRSRCQKRRPMRLTPRRNGEAKPVVIFFVPLCISSDDMAIIARISPACVLVGWPVGLIYACMMTNKQHCCCSYRPWPVDRQLYWTRWIASAAFQSTEPAKESPVLCLPIHRWLEYVQEGTGRSIPFFSRT